MKELSEISGSLENKEDVKPGVYRSRLMSFVHRQAYRLRESVGLGFRQVKVSVQWTGQILLSPLRWLDRFKQNPDRQIAGQTKKSKQLPPTLQKPRIAVESILAEVTAAGYGELQMPLREDWSVVDAKDWDTTLLGGNQLTLQGESAPPQRTKPVIRGLASLLIDRSLVLVDRYNQILDVLSPSQQFHLQCQIDPVLAQQWSVAQATAPDLAAVADQLALNAASSQQFLPAAPPTTPWQKLGYWLHYYREYLWIDSSEKDPAGQITLSSPGQMVMPTRQFTEPLVVSSKNSTGKLTAVSTDQNSGSSALNNVKKTIQERSQEWEVEGAHIMARQTSSQTIFTPEWIDAPTSDLGYHRSIFVRLMEWLDQLILTLENWIIWIFQRLFQKSN
jgi:hypothetical protein